MRVWLTIFLLGLSVSTFATPNFDRRLPNGAEIEIGERVFEEKIICDACEFDAESFNRQTAKALMPRLARDADIGRSLTYLERVSLQFYLVRTYKLSL